MMVERVYPVEAKSIPEVMGHQSRQTTDPLTALSGLNCILNMINDRDGCIPGKGSWYGQVYVTSDILLRKSHEERPERMGQSKSAVAIQTEIVFWKWRDDASMVKSTGSTSRGPRINL